MAMRTTTLWRLAALAAAAALFSVLAAAASGGRDGKEIRWDIVSIDFAAGTVSAGGFASATANDGSKITLTGSGTFDPHEDDDVTGGGTWKTFDAAGAESGSGRYKVTELVSWHVAPGTLPPLTDRIGRSQDARAGLAVFQIRSSHGGGLGKLVVSCHLVGTPDSVFEGITASMGFVDYTHPDAPAAGVDANRTLFHVVRDD
jgi:hypothetical protein